MSLIIAASMSLLLTQQATFPGAEAQQEMARLEALAGSWNARIEVMQPDGSWQTTGEEAVDIHYMLNRLALREEPAEHPVNPFRLESTIQYDQNRDLYRLVAMDDTWGNMDIYEGSWSQSDALVLTNLRSGTSYVGADGSTLHFRLTTRIEGPDLNVFTVEMSADAGETWRPYQRITRSRLDEAQ